MELLFNKDQSWEVQRGWGKEWSLPICSIHSLLHILSWHCLLCWNTLDLWSLQRYAILEGMAWYTTHKTTKMLSKSAKFQSGCVCIKENLDLPTNKTHIVLKHLLKGSITIVISDWIINITCHLSMKHQIWYRYRTRHGHRDTVNVQNIGHRAPYICK